MSYNFDKMMSTGARKGANAAFGICGALIGLALGAKPSSRRSRPKGPRRPRRPKWF